MENDFTTQLSREVVWVSFGEHRGYWFPALGAHTLAGYIGNSAQDNPLQSIWYYEKDDITSFLGRITLLVPRWIMFSVNIGYEHDAMNLAVRLGKALINHRGCGFIFGNRACSNHTWVGMILKQFPEAVVVDGEGELAVAGLLHGISPVNLPNCWFLQNHVAVFSYPEPTPDKEIRAPCYSLEILNSKDLALNQTVSLVETSRGCSKRTACTFCVHSCNSVKDKGSMEWRAVSFREIEESIRRVSAYRPKTINFVSEDLVGPCDEYFNDFLDFLDSLRNNRVLQPYTTLYGAMKVSDIAWSHDSPQTQRLKRERLGRMKALGFTTLYIGFESGNNAQLRRYGKYTRKQDNLHAIEILRDIGISIDGGFITFDPFVSFDEIKCNLDFLEQTQVPKLFIFPFSSLYVIPGSGYSRMLSRKKFAAPLVSEFIDIIECVKFDLDYHFLEGFLQQLRLCYFAGDSEGARVLEVLALEYGSCAIHFIRAVMQELCLGENHDRIKSVIDEYRTKEMDISARMLAHIAPHIAMRESKGTGSHC